MGFKFVLFVFLNLQPTFIKTSQVRKKACGRENISVSILQAAIRKENPTKHTLKRQDYFSCKAAAKYDFSSLILDFQH